MPQTTKAAADHEKLAEIQDALRTGTLSQNLREKANKLTMSKNDILGQRNKSLGLNNT